MSFSESLTVRILGDSSGLRQELDQVTSDIENLQQNLSNATGATGQLQKSFGKLSAGLKPLQKINAQLTQVQQKINAISQRPITLNVQPAINALQQLMRYAMIAAQQIQTIMGTTGGGRTTPNIPMGGGGGPATGGGGSPRQKLFAAGGLVSGPSGIDKVSTRLTAGEYVFSESAVKSLGLNYLDQLNRHPEQPSHTSSRPALSKLSNNPQPRISKVLNGSLTSPTPNSQSAFRSSPPTNMSTQQTENNFGGITINVAEATDVDTLFRDFRSQGITQRHRRG